MKPLSQARPPIPGRLCVAIAAALATVILTAAPARADVAYTLSGNLDWKLDWRSGLSEQDLDTSATLALRAGDPWHHTLTARFLGSVWFDLDGDLDTYGFHPFDDLGNNNDSGWTGRLLEAHIDLNRIAFVKFARFGRQLWEGDHGYRFDGIAFKTVDLFGDASPWRLQVAGFGGIPVHFWEPSSLGDDCGGGRVVLGWRQVAEFSVEVTKARDRSDLWGREDATRTTLISLAGRFRPAEGLTLRPRFDLQNLGTSDLQFVPGQGSLLAVGNWPSSGWSGRAQLRARFRGRENPVLEQNAFETVVGEEGRSYDALLSLEKRLSKNFQVNGGGSCSLVEGDDQGFGRDGGEAHLSVRCQDLPWKDLSVDATFEIWDASGEPVRAGARVEARYRHRVGSEKNRRVLFDMRGSAGYLTWTRLENGESVEERVLGVSFRGTWRPCREFHVGARVQFGNDGFDNITRITLEAGVRF